jgi:hypothetical protein
MFELLLAAEPAKVNPTPCRQLACVPPVPETRAAGGEFVAVPGLVLPAGRGFRAPGGEFEAQAESCSWCERRAGVIDVVEDEVLDISGGMLRSEVRRVKNLTWSGLELPDSGPDLAAQLLLL